MLETDEKRQRERRAQRQAYRQAGRQADRQTGTETDKGRQTYRQAGRQADRQTGTETDKGRQTLRSRKPGKQRGEGRGCRGREKEWTDKSSPPLQLIYNMLCPSLIPEIKIMQTPFFCVFC